MDEDTLSVTIAQAMADFTLCAAAPGMAMTDFIAARIISLISAARQQETVISDEVVEAMCRAHDGEESAQMGEPSLWAIRDRGDWTETCEGDGGWENYHSSRLAAMRAALALLPGGVPDREAIARVIGSYVVYDDKGGPDTEVLQDVIGGDYDESVRRVYELTDAIIAMLSAAPKVDGSSRNLPSRTTQEPPSPTPCDLEGK